MNRGNFFSELEVRPCEQLAAMRLEEFKAHLRTIAGGDPKPSAPRPNPSLVRNRKLRRQRKVKRLKQQS
jgi:hypothetical protein